MENVFRAGKSRETERGKPSACTLCSARFCRATMLLLEDFAWKLIFTADKIEFGKQNWTKPVPPKTTTKMYFSHSTAFLQKKVDCVKQINLWSQKPIFAEKAEWAKLAKVWNEKPISAEKNTCRKLAVERRLKIAQVLQQATKFCFKKNAIAPDETTKKRGN